MKTNVTVGNPNPTATLAIKKGRVKIYNKKSAIPTYYLQKGQEFQIEVFNPTTDKVLAKIKMNGKLISQSGLVLRPGERVFLDRYFDIDKKFKFDTYEVSGGDEVKQAIRANGDVEILFYKEVQRGPIFLTPNHTSINTLNTQDWSLYSNSTGGYVHGSNTTDITFGTTSCSSNTVTMDSFSAGSLDITGSLDVTRRVKSPVPSEKKLKSRLSKKIETGRVEEGAVSGQKFETVNVEFERCTFHTVSYKLLPISQKNVETQDLHKSYCTNCGAKAKAKDNFCSKCGRKL